MFRGLAEDALQLQREFLGVFQKHFLENLKVPRKVKNQFFNAYIMEHVCNHYKIVAICAPRLRTSVQLRKAFTTVEDPQSKSLFSEFLINLLSAPNYGVLFPEDRYSFLLL